MRLRLPASAAAARSIMGAIMGAITGALLAGPARAQDLTLESHPTRWRISLERFEADEGNDLGLVGLYVDLLDVWPGTVPGLYAGVGGEAAVTGTTGGLFLGGATVGWLEEIYPGWNLDFGLLAGAGGGGSDTGSGFVLRPHAAVEKVIGMTAIRLELVHLDFVNGEIEDTHLALGLSLPGEILQAASGRPPDFVPPSELHWRRIRITPTLTRIFPASGAKKTDGTPQEEDLDLAGAEVDYFIGDTLYLPVEINAAVGGDAGGFLTAMGGLGASWPIGLPGLTLDGKLLVGAGGGGDVDSGGGFLWGGQAGLAWAFLRDVSVQVLGGYLDAPDGDFEGTTLSAGLSWTPVAAELAYDYPRENLERQGLPGSAARLDPMRVQLMNKTYLPESSAHKVNGGELDDAINLLGLGIQRPIEIFHQDCAVTAAAFGAWDGGVGGYAEGLLGLQYELAPFKNARFHTVTLRGEIGAGGGGDVDVGPGLIYALSAGWRFQYSRDLALSLDVGSVEADTGSFHASAFTLGVSYVLNRAIQH
jgi:hypothetical protein